MENDQFKFKFSSLDTKVTCLLLTIARQNEFREISECKTPELPCGKCTTPHRVRKQIEAAVRIADKQGKN